MIVYVCSMLRGNKHPALISKAYDACAGVPLAQCQVVHHSQQMPRV